MVHVLSSSKSAGEGPVTQWSNTTSEIRCTCKVPTVNWFCLKIGTLNYKYHECTSRNRLFCNLKLTFSYLHVLQIHSLINPHGLLNIAVWHHLLSRSMCFTFIFKWQASSSKNVMQQLYPHICNTYIQHHWAEEYSVHVYTKQAEEYSIHTYTKLSRSERTHFSMHISLRRREKKKWCWCLMEWI